MKKTFKILYLMLFSSVLLFSCKANVESSSSNISNTFEPTNSTTQESSSVNDSSSSSSIQTSLTTTQQSSSSNISEAPSYSETSSC